MRLKRTQQINDAVAHYKRLDFDGKRGLGELEVSGDNDVTDEKGPQNQSPNKGAKATKEVDPSNTKGEKHTKDEDKEVETITHGNLIYIHQMLKTHSTYSMTLFDLCRGSSVHVPKPKPVVRPKSREYLEMMERLREEQKEREYQELMGASVDLHHHHQQQSPGSMVKEVKEQLATIANILVSVGSVSFAMWYWAGSSMGLNAAHRTLLALLAGIVVLVAEVVVYGRYKLKIQEARETEQSKTEVTSVLASAEYPPPPPTNSSYDKHNTEKSTNAKINNKATATTSSSGAKSRPKNARKRKV